MPRNDRDAGGKSQGSKSPRFFWTAHRAPMPPGQFLETRYLQPGGISQDRLAKALGISRRRVNELVGGKRAITPDTAVRLAHFFGTDVDFWLRLQFAWDVYHVRRMYYQQQSCASRLTGMVFKMPQPIE